MMLRVQLGETEAAICSGRAKPFRSASGAPRYDFAAENRSAVFYVG